MGLSRGLERVQSGPRAALDRGSVPVDELVAWPSVAPRLRRPRPGAPRRAGLLALCLALVAACDAGRTEILVEVDSDLAVPDALDRVVISARAPDGRVQEARADLGPGERPLPRALGMVHRDGPLGPFEVDVVGQRAGSPVVTRRGVLTFREGETRVWRVALLEACRDVTCEAGRTCAAGVCRDEEVLQGELEPWDGTRSALDAGSLDAGSLDAGSLDAGSLDAGSLDAGTDACVPEDERCNERDDDCDGSVDEGFDLDADPDHCGECGNACSPPRRRCCGGTCAIMC